MKLILKTPLACAVLAALVLSTAQAQVIELVTMTADGGYGLPSTTNGDTQVNVKDLLHNKVQGDQWSVAELGNVTFTNSNLSPDGRFNIDTGGMGMNSTATGNSAWHFDATEAFTWTTSADLIFHGMTFRTNWNNTDQATVSSAHWGNLSINPTGDGITFATSGGIGTFTLDRVNMTGNNDEVRTITAAELGANANDLLVGGSGITFTATNDSSDVDNHGLTVTSLSFSVAVPEPSTYALLAGCLALASVMIRRRR